MKPSFITSIVLFIVVYMLIPIHITAHNQNHTMIGPYFFVKITDDSNAQDEKAQSDATKDPKSLDNPSDDDIFEDDEDENDNDMEDIPDDFYDYQEENL